MKKKSFQLSAISLVALALLTVSCSKGDVRIRLLAEHMTAAGNGAKVLMDPTNIDAAQWVAGEQINLGGTVYAIADDGEGGYCVNTGDDVLPSTLRALYPASVTDLRSNDIECRNHGGAVDSVLLHSLAINFRTGGHDVYFPMAATASTEATDMTFRHLTGGLKITLHNNSGAAVTLSSVKVVLVSATTVVPLEYSADGATVRTFWAAHGMSLPTGDLGGITDNVDISKTSEMNFYLHRDDTPNVTIAAGESLCFCVPVTVSSLTKVVVAGYNESHVQRFVKIKSLGSTTTIERNIMYTLPTIDIEN